MPDDTAAIILLYVTYPSQTEARAAARLALSGKLIACANIAAPHTACYVWNDAYTESEEVAVIFKTSAGRAAAAQDFLTKHHSYDCPCILRIDAAASPDFSRWVNTQSSPA